MSNSSRSTQQTFAPITGRKRTFDEHSSNLCSYIPQPDRETLMRRATSYPVDNFIQEFPNIYNSKLPVCILPDSYFEIS